MPKYNKATIAHIKSEHYHLVSSYIPDTKLDVSYVFADDIYELSAWVDYYHAEEKKRKYDLALRFPVESADMMKQLLSEVENLETTEGDYTAKVVADRFEFFTKEEPDGDIPHHDEDEEAFVRHRLDIMGHVYHYDEEDAKWEFEEWGSFFEVGLTIVITHKGETVASK